VTGCHVIKLRGHWCDIVLNVHASTNDMKNSFYKELEHLLSKFLEYHMKTSDFNANVEREDIFKQTIRNESLHELSNDNGVRGVNFVISKNLVLKNTMFPHCSIHKYIWTSPDGKIHNQIDHVLIDKKRH
jgi:hypothetical protein